MDHGGVACDVWCTLWPLSCSLQTSLPSGQYMVCKVMHSYKKTKPPLQTIQCLHTAPYAGRTKAGYPYIHSMYRYNQNVMTSRIFCYILCPSVAPPELRTSQPFAHVLSGPAGGGLMMRVMCRRPNIWPSCCHWSGPLLPTCLPSLRFISRQPSPKLRLQCSWLDQTDCRWLTGVCGKPVSGFWSDFIHIICLSTFLFPSYLN